MAIALVLLFLTKSQLRVANDEQHMPTKALFSTKARNENGAPDPRGLVGDIDLFMCLFRFTAGFDDLECTFSFHRAICGCILIRGGQQM